MSSNTLGMIFLNIQSVNANFVELIILASMGKVMIWVGYGFMCRV